MFSGPDTVSLYEVHEQIVDIVYINRASPELLEVAKSHEFQSENPDIFWWPLAKRTFLFFILMRNSFSLTSPDGMTLRASNLFCDRLEIAESAELRLEYEEAAGHDWLFLEHPTLLLSTKSWDNFGKSMLVGNNAVDDVWTSAVAERVRPFEGWSLCIPKSDAPTNLSDVLMVIGDYKGPKATDGRRKAGRKPTGARPEYFRRYPVEKPEGLTFEAISAELSEAGFPISARQLQTYESERNNGDFKTS